MLNSFSNLLSSYLFAIARIKVEVTVITGSTCKGSPTIIHLLALYNNPIALKGVACPASSIITIPNSFSPKSLNALETEAKVVDKTGISKFKVWKHSLKTFFLSSIE